MDAHNVSGGASAQGLTTLDHHSDRKNVTLSEPYAGALVSNAPESPHGGHPLQDTDVAMFLDGSRTNY